MQDQEAGEAFVQDLQYALRNLYDPAALRKSPLLGWFVLEKRSNPAGALRDLLTAAIHALKPSPAIPPDSAAWRVFWILTFRYIEQSGQATVAANLGLSDRQLRRLERLAEQALADSLWDQHELAERAGQVHQTSNDSPSREEELAWLHESLPTESAQVADVIGSVLRLIAPLAQVSGVQIICELPDELPLIAGQLSIVRQALLNLLTAAVNSAVSSAADAGAGSGAEKAGGGTVRVSASVAAHGVGITIHADSGSAAEPRDGRKTGPAMPAAAGSKIVEPLEMARQLLQVAGGALQIAAPGETAHSLLAALVLPVSEQVEVLVIDDNSDTLRLMQRYLLGTRYRFVGARDPEAALTLAAAQPPRVIVLDVMMPGIDDWELLGRLRAHPQTSLVPIIVSTILPQEQLALALGAGGFIRKPVSRQALLAALDRQMNLY